MGHIRVHVMKVQGGGILRVHLMKVQERGGQLRVHVMKVASVKLPGQLPRKV